MKPCIVVAGMARCGTSLMMQALDAMGVPCIGGWPDYETEQSSMALFDPVSFANLSDASIKLIDPANLGRFTMPKHVVLWMKRDFREQARSQVKFLRAGGVPILQPTGKVVRAFEASLAKSERKHQSAVGVGRGTSLVVQFEKLLEEPRSVMAFTAHFLGRFGWADLDPTIGAAEVIKRRPRCYDGMLEAEMLERGRGKVPA